MNSTLLPDHLVPFWLMLPLLGALLTGLVLLVWGRTIPRSGDWVATFGLVALLVGLTVSWHKQLSIGDAGVWLRGWILPREEHGAIVVGFLQDNIGFAVSIIGAILSAVLFLARPRIILEPRAERLFASTVIGAVGLSVAWLSLTPGLSLIGIVLVIFAGFIAMGSRWEEQDESILAARYGRERALGAVLLISGAAAIASSGGSLVWHADAVWPTDSVGLLGGVLLVAGLFIQSHPFPLLGLATTPSRVYVPVRLLVVHVFPAWAGLSVFVRFYPQLHSLGVFPVFGWVAMMSAALATVSGLLHKDWRLSLTLWVSAAQSVALAALAFAGPWPAFAISVATGVGAVVIALAGEAGAVSREGISKVSSVWMKAAAFAGALAGCGMIGFVSAGGYVRWIFAAGGDMSRAGAYAFGVFLVALLLWKTTWSAVRAIKPSCLAWYEIIAPFICVLFALGVLWTGTLTGGVVPGSSDAVTGSLMNHFFGAADEAAEFFVTASGLHWGALVVAIVVAYMTTARQQDAWSRLCGSFPRFARFVTTGYGVDFVFSRFLTGLNWFGSVLYRFIDVNAWDRWMPAVVRWISRRVIFPVARVSEIIVFVLDVGVRKLVELPAKVLQLVQSGDVQWYLFFAVGSGIAILIHFLRF